jgi:hypothetical protein
VRRAAIGALVAAAVGVGTVGIAGGALKEKRAGVELEVEETGTPTAKCGKGTRAVAGGFDDPTFDAVAPPGSFAQTFTSRRASKRKWTSVITNGLGIDETTVFTYAYCSDTLPKLKAVAATITIPDDETRSVTARCPRGGEVVSGGFAGEQFDAFDGAFPIESRRAGKRGWIASGHGDGDSNLTSYAYCAKDKVGLKARSVQASQSSGAENLSLEARCRKRERVISGGFAGPWADAGFVEPFESRRTGRRVWTATTGAFGEVDWEVFAYCMKKERRG